MPSSPEMKISDPSADRVCDEDVIVKNLLPLRGAHVLELGCGKAEKTRAMVPLPEPVRQRAKASIERLLASEKP